MVMRNGWSLSGSFEDVDIMVIIMNEKFIIRLEGVGVGLVKGRGNKLDMFQRVKSKKF